MIQRPYFQTIMTRVKEPRKFIQIIEGPRQVGKSTLIKQILQTVDMPYLHFSADNIPASRNYWISDCWIAARTKIESEKLNELLLVIDEIQKLQNWAEVVKKEWDQDTFYDINIKVVLLGSSRIRLEKGLSESLKGRFEVIKMPNWSYKELKDAFGFSIEEYIYFGAYPGAADLRFDLDRWRDYISSSIVDATINNDILIDTPINKPALLKKTFELSAAYSGQILSFTKILGQLQDAGNTTTLSNYLQVLSEAGMVAPLQKFSIDLARRRASVPKYQVYNNALTSLYSEHTFEQALNNRQLWGRLLESAVGAHILNCAYRSRFEVCYWRENNKEVDFVLTRNSKIIAIEVKSNQDKTTAGLHEFENRFHPHKILLVGEQGLPVETFLQTDLNDLFS